MSSPNTAGKHATRTQEHAGDWPNTAAFDSSYEQHERIELKVHGQIPSYAAGTLYRTGPRGHRISTKAATKDVKISHWFDGLSVLHRFELTAPGLESSAKKDDNTGGKIITKVWYNSRSTTDALLERVRKTGHVEYLSFAQKRDPCQSIFAKLFTNFTAPFLADDPTHSSENLGVTLALSRIGSTTGEVELIARSDIAKFQTIQPETLQPLGVAQQTILHPDLTGQLSAAHARSDPESGDVYNYNLSLGFTATYKIFCTSATSGETTILATFPAQASYIHSFFLTRRFVVLCVWNGWLQAKGMTILLHGNMLDSIKRGINAGDRATWYVVDRVSGRGLVKTFESEPFFAFHTVNAWDVAHESNNDYVDVVAEVAAYDDTDIMHKLYHDNIMSDSPAAQERVATQGASIRNSHVRFRLPKIPLDEKTTLSEATREIGTALLEYKVTSDESPELPMINPRFVTLPHRYTYGISFRKAAFADTLIKFDSHTKTAIAWQEDGCTPGEAIFIPKPQELHDGDNAEDDGVLLSIVLNGYTERSFLICLDATTMAEVGRAEIPGAIGLGFHGTFAPADSRAEQRPDV